MTRGRPLLLYSTLLVAFLFGVVFLRSDRGPRPCKATFVQVHKGMTRAEVTTTVGGLPGDYRTSDRYGNASGETGYMFFDFWIANNGVLYVGYGDDGRANFVEASDTWGFPPTFLDRIRDCLRL